MNRDRLRQSIYKPTPSRSCSLHRNAWSQFFVGSKQLAVKLMAISLIYYFLSRELGQIARFERRSIKINFEKSCRFVAACSAERQEKLKSALLAKWSSKSQLWHYRLHVEYVRQKFNSSLVTSTIDLFRWQTKLITWSDQQHDNWISITYAEMNRFKRAFGAQVAGYWKSWWFNHSFAEIVSKCYQKFTRSQIVI